MDININKSDAIYHNSSTLKLGLYLCTWVDFVLGISKEYECVCSVTLQFLHSGLSDIFNLCKFDSLTIWTILALASNVWYLCSCLLYTTMSLIPFWIAGVWY